MMLVTRRRQPLMTVRIWLDQSRNAVWKYVEELGGERAEMGADVEHRLWTVALEPKAFE